MDFTSLNNGGQTIDFDFFNKKDAPLSVLTFKACALHAVFSDGVKRPGIYGTLFCPIELLDVLQIKNGTNINAVRFSGQFRWSQSMLDKYLGEGLRVNISSNLLITLE